MGPNNLSKVPGMVILGIAPLSQVLVFNFKISFLYYFISFKSFKGPDPGK